MSKINLKGQTIKNCPYKNYNINNIYYLYTYRAAYDHENKGNVSGVVQKPWAYTTDLNST